MADTLDLGAILTTRQAPRQQGGARFATRDFGVCHILAEMHQKQAKTSTRH